MIVKDSASLSSHALILPTHVAGKAGVPATTSAVDGAIGIVSLPLIMGHSFSALKINVSLCFHMLY